MTIIKLSGEFSVCKVAALTEVPLAKEFTFLAVTDDEISLVCKSENVPEHTVALESGWRCLKINGTLDFSMVGVIARISGILAENQISLFVVSTFNTDYILLKTEMFDKAVLLLTEKGYVFVDADASNVSDNN